MKSREIILSTLEGHPDFPARKLAESLIKRDGPDKGGIWVVISSSQKSNK